MVLLCLINSKMINAQTDSNSSITSLGKTYTQIFDSLTSGLIKERVPNGILYDRVVKDWSYLESNNNYTDPYRMFQAWWDIEKSMYNSKIATYESMRQEVLNKQLKNRIPIITINTTMGSIDSNALLDGRLFKENGILTDAGLENPYRTLNISLAGLASDEFDLDAAYAFCYIPEFNFTGLHTTYDRLQIEDVTDQRVYEIVLNNEVLADFRKEGEHVLLIKGYTNNGLTELLGETKISLKKIRGGGDWQPSCMPTNELISSVIPYKGIDEIIGTTTHADFHIFYHYQNAQSTVCEQILKKPIIVLDGFDPLDGLTIPIANTTTTINGNVTKTGFRDYKSFYFNNFKNYENENSLGEEYRKQGYDVVVLNFPALGSIISRFLNGFGQTNDLLIPSIVKDANGANVNLNGRGGGADYVQRNAFVLVELIKKLNAQLALNGSNEKLIIIGPSMGGQISRFALAYMEKQANLNPTVPSWNHNTKLWISFDSPHEGANVPIGTQQAAFILGADGNQNATDLFHQVVRAKCSKQFLIEQAVPIGGGLQAQLSGSSPFFIDYYAALKTNGLPNSNGYPQNLRKVTWINGSGSNTPVGIANQKSIHVRAFKYSWLKAFELITKFGDVNQQSVITCERMRLIPNTLSLGSQTTSFSISNSNPRGNLDCVNGGTRDNQLQLKKFLDKSLDSLVNVGELASYSITDVQEKDCFIPSVSALGLKNTSGNWLQIFNNRNLVCTGEIPFDNYYHPLVNEPHSYINTKSAEWLSQEINHGKLGCPTLCNNYTISGPSSATFQSGTSSQLLAYTIQSSVSNDATFQNASISWTSSAGLVFAYSTIVNGIRTAYFTVKCTSDPNQFVEAKISPKNTIDQTLCPLTAVRYTVTIANPVIFPDLEFIVPTCISNVLKKVEIKQKTTLGTLITPSNAFTYKYDLNFTSSMQGLYSPNYTNWTIGNILNIYNGTSTNTGYNHRIYVEITSPCGLKKTVIKDLPVTQYNPTCPFRTINNETDSNQIEILISPNPTGTNWKVIIDNSFTTKCNYKIRDLSGKLIRSESIHLDRYKSFEIDGTFLNAGIYFVEIQIADKVHLLKLIKI